MKKTNMITSLLLTIILMITPITDLMTVYAADRLCFDPVDRNTIDTEDEGMLFSQELPDIEGDVETGNDEGSEEDIIYSDGMTILTRIDLTINMEEINLKTSITESSANLSINNNIGKSESMNGKIILHKSVPLLMHKEGDRWTCPDEISSYSGVNVNEKKYYGVSFYIGPANNYILADDLSVYINDEDKTASVIKIPSGKYTRIVLPFGYPTKDVSVSIKEPTGYYHYTGKKKKYEATVKGANNTSVNWSISGNKDSNTKINNGGELTVSRNENASVISITAKSVDSPEKSASRDVLIKKSTRLNKA